MPEDVLSTFDGLSVLVTGGTGSFGQKFVETVLERYKPARLIVFSRDEYKQFVMQQKYPVERYPNMRYFLGDVRDSARLHMAMRGVDIVVHAAALKHVPAAEYNPFECIQTNVIGAENVVTAAINAGVSRVLALSTDKAANPANLYGASKLASDKIFVAANNLSGGRKPRFACVRYGNVLGSRGSVVPFFRNLVAQGQDHLPITDARMTRFFITLQDGVDFVLRSLSYMQGGEIFVPKIPSIKVTDLATAIAPNLPQKVIGIRPGEKLHEIMVTADDAAQTIELQDQYVIQPMLSSWRPDIYLAKGAKPCEEAFHYSSNNNPHWLDVPEIGALLGRLGM